MQKYVLRVIGILGFFVLIVSCTAKKESRYDSILAQKKIIVGTSADYPPYEFHIQKNGKDEIVGFDIAIAKTIAESMGVELIIRDMDFDGLLAALVSGSVDMVLAGMTPTNERRENVDFSSIYYTAVQGVLIRKSDSEQYGTAPQALKDAMLGVQRGSVQVSIAKKEIKAVPDAKIEEAHAQIKELAKIPDLIMELKNGKIDALIVEMPVAKNYAKVHEDLMLAAYTFKDSESGAAVAVKKGETQLINEINKAIAALQSQGKINEFVVSAIEMVE